MKKKKKIKEGLHENEKKVRRKRNIDNEGGDGTLGEKKKKRKMRTKTNK